MFDFDPAKSAANKTKHGIDFVEAHSLWDGEYLAEIGVVDYGGEERRLLVGETGGKNAGQQSSLGAVSTSGSSPSVIRDPAKKWPMTAEEFDEMFDNGEDIDHLIDWSSARLVHSPKNEVTKTPKK